ncbi:MAG: DUF3592 domain-containing protein [Clostridia bacterium]|nr:DUF3592 domain-containing protein [Clostridia bacterium]
MNNNKTWVIILCGIIGLGLIVYGIVQIVKVSNYSETTGKYTYSVMRESRDSDGNRSTYYIWYYDFIVDGTKYTAKSDSESSNDPLNKEEKIFYNPANPNENTISTDYGRYAIIVAGIIFLGTALLVRPKNVQSTSETQSTSEAKMGWAILLFSLCVLLIIFMAANFNIGTLLTKMLFPTIIMAIFIGIGIYLLIRSHKPEMQNAESTDIGNDLLNEANKIIENEKLQNARNVVFKVKGIWQIISGIIWCILVFSPQIISALVVLFSLNSKNPTYTLNGEEVTAIQFIFGATSIFQFIGLAVGIIIIVQGIRNLKACKEDNQNMQ